MSREIAVIDLVTGEPRTVAETRGWDVQLGAQTQWGADDRTLLFNDIEVRDWMPYGVRLDLQTGEVAAARRHDLFGVARRPLGRQPLPASDGRDTARLRRGRAEAVHSRESGGERRTTASGSPTCRPAIRACWCRSRRSWRTAVPPLPVARKRGDFFSFHVKWNPQGTRLMLALRWLPRSLLPWKRKRRYGAKHVVTMNADGSHVRVAVSAERWAKGGHHPNWCPDGEHVLMNLNTQGDGLRFARLALDGSICETLVPAIAGSGHPTLHPDGRHLLTDAYVDEPLAFGDGTTPLRLVDLRSGQRNATGAHRNPAAGRTFDRHIAGRSASGLGPHLHAHRIQCLSGRKAARLRRRSRRHPARRLIAGLPARISAAATTGECEQCRDCLADTIGDAQLGSAANHRRAPDRVVQQRGGGLRNCGRRALGRCRDLQAYRPADAPILVARERNGDDRSPVRQHVDHRRAAVADDHQRLRQQVLHFVGLDPRQQREARVALVRDGLATRSAPPCAGRWRRRIRAPRR